MTTQNPWDERYAAEEYFYGTEPNDFLKAHVSEIPAGGKVLCLAEGEGRNAVFLARQGFQVTAVDGSAVGLGKLQKLASQYGVQVQTIHSDLADFQIEPQSWDGIVSVWCHVPPALRGTLHAKCAEGLKEGGVFLLEAYHPRQLDYKTGGPPVAELMMTPSALKQELASLELSRCEDLDRNVQEGKGHFGKSAVSQVIGRKTSSVARQQILEALQWRYATKLFDENRKIPQGDWETLIESLRLAPSAYGLQPWKFLVVQAQDLRKPLRAASWNQSQVTDCSHYVVFAHKREVTEADVKFYIASVAETRGLTPSDLQGYEKMILGDVVHGPRAQKITEWVQRQQYIAMGFLLETAALLKIDACPMEGIDAAEYDRILGLSSSEWTTVSSVALGYRRSDDRYQHLKKVRLGTDRLFEVRE